MVDGIQARIRNKVHQPSTINRQPSTQAGGFMKMKISDIIEVLETLAPLPYQEPYDNSGLLLGTAEEDCLGALVSLDATEAVVAEAVQKGCNLLISHHPLIFRGLNKSVLIMERVEL